MSTFIVNAREPTLLSHLSTYTLPLTDLITAYTCEVAHVVPGPLDASRLCDALARTLSLYPLASGRLRPRREADAPWEIELNNQGVPVTVLNAADCSPLSTIVQRPLSLVQSLDVPKIISAAVGEPLMRVTLTRLPNGSNSIGVATWHPLGDGNTVLRMMRLLSQTYQGLPPLDPPPVYEEPSGSCSYTDLSPVETPCHNSTYPIGRPPVQTQEPVRLDFRLTERQTQELKEAVRRMGPTKQDGMRWLSRQDCLVALLAKCISIADSTSAAVDTIHTLLNGRGSGDIPTSAAGNALIWATAKRMPSHDLHAIASGIRTSVCRGREPAFVASFSAAVGERNRAVAAANRALDVAPMSGSMTVNSSMRFDWTSAHFGYPGRARFYHTAPRFARYVKLFAANPERAPDGEWRTRVGDVEVALSLSSPAVREEFIRVLTRELRALGVPGAVEWVVES